MQQPAKQNTESFSSFLIYEAFSRNWRTRLHFSAAGKLRRIFSRWINVAYILIENRFDSEYQSDEKIINEDPSILFDNKIKWLNNIDNFFSNLLWFSHFISKLKAISCEKRVGEEYDEMVTRNSKFWKVNSKHTFHNSIAFVGFLHKLAGIKINIVATELR